MFNYGCRWANRKIDSMTVNTYSIKGSPAWQHSYFQGWGQVHQHLYLPVLKYIFSSSLYFILVLSLKNVLVHKVLERKYIAHCCKYISFYYYYFFLYLTSLFIENRLNNLKIKLSYDFIWLCLLHNLLHKFIHFYFIMYEMGKIDVILPCIFVDYVSIRY